MRKKWKHSELCPTISQKQQVLGFIMVLHSQSQSCPTMVFTVTLMLVTFLYLSRRFAVDLQFRSSNFWCSVQPSGVNSITAKSLYPSWIITHAWDKDIFGGKFKNEIQKTKNTFFKNYIETIQRELLLTGKSVP